MLRFLMLLPALKTLALNDPDPDPQPDPAPDPDPQPSGDDDPPPDPKPDTDWQAEARKWQGLARKHEDRAKVNADKAKQFDELEEAKKTELERLTGKADKANQDAKAAKAEALRYRVALEKGLPADLVEFLSGDTPEDIEAKADTLIARLKPADPDPDPDPDPTPTRRPQERMRPGAAPDAEPVEMDPEKLAESVPRPW